MARSPDPEGEGAAAPRSALAWLTFEALLEPFCLMLADKLATRLERGQARLISQSQSELGPRQHRAAVRRRIDKGEGGAFRRGRKHLLTLEAYYEELARTEEPLSSPPSGKRRSKASNDTVAVPAGAPRKSAADFQRELLTGLRRVRGGDR
jgi:hypothetical protein